MKKKKEESPTSFSLPLPVGVVGGRRKRPGRLPHVPEAQGRVIAGGDHVVLFVGVEV
jgi:hypothetical protein